MPALHGLRLPLSMQSCEEILDSEYADDTMIFSEFSDLALDRLRSTLDRFCLASGAKISWEKSSGFLVGTDAQSTWGQDVGFTWLQPGESCRYLGFQIGLDITSAQKFEPVLVSIRKKLAHWSQSHLSLAERALGFACYCLVCGFLLDVTQWCYRALSAELFMGWIRWPA